jgi:hypothetical protein
MKENKEIKKTRNITFRLTDEEFIKIENTAWRLATIRITGAGQAALGQLSEAHTFTKNERLIYQEIALLRFLIGHGFKRFSVKARRRHLRGRS